MGLESVSACCGVESADRELWPQGVRWPTGENQLKTKITQSDMVKRRNSYRSI